MNKRFEKEIRLAFKKKMPLRISDEHLSKTIQAVHSAYQNHEWRKRISFREFFLREVRFMGWKIWLLQCSLLIFIFGMLNILFGGDLIYITKRHIPLTLGLCAVAVALMGLPFLKRSLQYKMYEVEAATLMSIPKLFLSRLLIIGLGDIFSLLGISLIACIKTRILMTSIFACLLLPFLIACCSIIFLMKHIKGRYGAFICGMFCLGALFLAKMIDAVLPASFLQTGLYIIVLLCITFAVFLFLQLKALLRSIALLELSFI